MATNSPNPVDGDVQACKPKRSDHSQLATEIVHNLVSTDSCDEEVTEKLILWVINRLNKEFPTPPAQLLHPVELPKPIQQTEASDYGLESRDGYGLYWGSVETLKLVAESLRQQGYEVKS